MLDPFCPTLHGGVQFSHDHPVSGLGDGFQEMNWTDFGTASGAPPSRPRCFTCGGGAGEAFTVMDAPTGPFTLPVPAEMPPLAMEVHTLRWGAAEWLAECAPSLASWCARHGHDLNVWGREDVPAGYPNEKFILIDLLRAFVAQEKNERFLWIDADVWCHPLAPEFPCHAPGIHVMPDQPSGAIKTWPEWMQTHYGRQPRQDFRYRNAGIWACDRESATALLVQIASHSLTEGWMEQHQFNVWLHDLGERVAELLKAESLKAESLVAESLVAESLKAESLKAESLKAESLSFLNFTNDSAIHDSAKIHDLPREWNSFPGNGAAWFHHFAGRNKEKRILKARQRGVIPDPVKHHECKIPLPDYGEGAVVWPYRAGAAQWDELWFSHRSVIEHWSEKDWPLILLGDECPAWWPGKFIHSPRYEDALWLGTQCAENVLWMNDDIFLLADQSPNTLARAAVLENMHPKLGNQLVARNSWRRGLGQVLLRLHHHGRGVLNFSTHTPYLYRRPKVGEIFREFGSFYKIPFETAYHNWHATPTAPASDAKSKGPHDLAGKLWINPSHGQATAAFRSELADRFGCPPPAISLR